MFNPKTLGWLQYYGRYYHSALYPPMRPLPENVAAYRELRYMDPTPPFRGAVFWGISGRAERGEESARQPGINDVLLRGPAAARVRSRRLPTNSSAVLSR